jgi:lysozyme
MTVKPLKLGFTPEEFTSYMKTVKLTDWKPVGVVLHNTAMPTLKMVQNYISSKQWTFEQLIDNWWVRYIKSGWSAGPHLFIMPDKIWVATPLTMRGTHSPSYNSTYWGIEMIGDFETELCPPETRANTVHALKEMYKLIGVVPNDKNFHFHGEDPRSTHHGCPGKNVHPKSGWLAEMSKSNHINQILARENDICDEAISLVKHWEAFRADPYDDRGSLAIGYGHTSKLGTLPVVTEDMKITEAEADKILRGDLAHLSEKITPLVKVKLTPNQLGALVSFCYNIGVTSFSSSTLLKKINSSDFVGAADEFLKWNKSTNPKTKVKEILVGLTKRRTAERELFLK